MRLGFVVQRYGLEVNGGAEHHCRRLAERMARRREVERVTVFTTCALDYRTWKNSYSPGAVRVNDVEVERFPVAFPRLSFLQSALGELALRGPRLELFETPWLIAQGPFAPALPRRLEEVRDEYDAFVFFTYLYYPTVYGMPRVREKAVFVPTAEDEPAIRLRRFREVFELPRAIAFNTMEERDFVQSCFDVSHVPQAIVGCGIDLPPGSAEPSDRPPYVLYVGRIDPMKGLDELSRGFDTFKRAHADLPIGGGFHGRDLRLLLVGRDSGARLPLRTDIERVGFVDEAEKLELIARSRAVMVPSVCESLSLALLEGWAARRPALVNGRCAVTSAHIERSGGGLAYTGSEDLGAKMALLLSNPGFAARCGGDGRRYVESSYSWNLVESRMLDLLESVVTAPRRHAA
jgi:glycosyltransferase involved in cell wall biosynthesis